MDEDYERQFHQIRASDFMSIQNHEKIKNNLEPNIDQFVLKAAKKCLPRVLKILKERQIPDEIKELQEQKEKHINKYLKYIENLDTTKFDNDFLIYKLHETNLGFKSQLKINQGIIQELVYRKFIRDSDDINIRKLALDGLDVWDRDFAFLPYLNAFNGMSFDEFLGKVNICEFPSDSDLLTHVCFGPGTMEKPLKNYSDLLCDYFERQKDLLCDLEKYVCIKSIFIIDDLLLLIKQDPYNSALKLAYFKKLKDFGLGLPSVRAK